MMGQLFFCIKKTILFLKGYGSPDEYFFKAYQINQYILYMHRRI